MADPKAYGCDVYEAEVAFSSFVVSRGDTAGVFELVEAAFDQVSQPVKPMIHTDTHFAGFSHWYLGQNVTLSHGFPDTISIIASICQQHARLGQIVIHHEIKADIVGRLSGRDVSSHRQSMRVDAEVDLGREPTS